MDIQEQIYEQAQELKTEDIEEFKDSNKADLRNEFVENHKIDFENFLKNEIIDSVYTIDYWKSIFCDEELEDDFNDYVNKCYSEFIENGNTK